MRDHAPIDLRVRAAPAPVHLPEHVAAPEKMPHPFVEIAKFTLVALLIITPFRLFVAQPFIVSGASMVPTFHPKEYLVVDEITYRVSEPMRGDVVIFKYPLDPSSFFIKRIVGMPGETVTITNGEVHVRNATEESEHILQEPYLHTPGRMKDAVVVTLKDDEYYVLGDNRAASSDSRAWGPVRRELIVGRAIVRLLPFKDADVLPGEYRYE